MFYNGANVKQVDVPTLTGSFGILASHVPTLQVLKPGVVTVYGEDGTATKYFGARGGRSREGIPGPSGGAQPWGVLCCSSAALPAECWIWERGCTVGCVWG